MLLELKDVRVFYGAVEAIKGVSLEVAEGEIVTLIGANGAGKTTILRTIVGLKKPASGEIRFQGTRIDKSPPQEIVGKGIAMVPEGRRIFPQMSVLDNLKMGAYLVKDGAAVEERLRMVFEYFPILRERKYQPGGSLSGGEQQMLAIGRALMSRPRLLLLDEPSLGLAPLVIRSLAQIIKALNEGGLTILLVEQNARLALRTARKGYVLETGRIVLSGETRELEKNDMVRRAYLGI